MLESSQVFVAERRRALTLKFQRFTLVALLALLFIAPAFIMQAKSATQSQTLYAHQETTTINGVTYYLHKASSADANGTTFSQSAVTVGRKLMGTWVYSLSGIVSMPASTWTVTYRAQKSASASSVVAHGDIDILIRKVDGTIRTTIATNVANSPSLSLTNIWETLTGTYNWPGFTVVSQTDYLEIDYYIEVTTPQNSKSVRLRVDDKTLPLADQTKITNVVFSYPNQAPAASFTFSPSYPIIYDPVSFDALASYDPDGSIVSYTWNFGDGNVTSITTPVIVHYYATAGSTVNYTVTLTVTDNEGGTGVTSQNVPLTNPSILYVSLPTGTYVGPDPDNWLSQCWLLNTTGSTQTFTVRINNTSGGVVSYDTHLLIALNSAAYNSLTSLTVNSTTIPKASFTNGTPTPYGFTITWENDVYPTWFSDVYVVGYIGSQSYKDVQVSATFSDATGVRMHFDAYGSTDSPPPSTGQHVTHNPHQKDSTVLFNAPPVVQYYLTVISPYGIVGGQGWYANGTTAYATLNTGTVDHGNGTRRVFTNWSGDASGTNYAQSNPITMNGPKTAVAVWKTQHLLTIKTNGLPATYPTNVYLGGSPVGTASDVSPYTKWFDAGSSTGTIGVDGTVSGPTDTQYVFVKWVEDSSTSNPRPSETMNSPKTVTAKYKTQYRVVFAQSGLDGTALGAVVTINGTGKTYGQLPDTSWVDSGKIINYFYSNVSSAISGKRFILIGVTGPTSPITVTGPVAVTGNYKTQYLLTVSTDPLGLSPQPTRNPIGEASPAGSWWYDASTTVTLTAQAVSGYTFINWDVNGTSQGNGVDPIVIQMNAHYIATAHYTPIIPQYLLTIKTIGLPSAYPTTVYLGGLPVGTASDSSAYIQLFASGASTGTIGVDGTVLGATGTRYVFVRWVEDSSTSNPRPSETMNSPKTFTAQYKTQYYLTVNSDYGTSSGAGWYDNSSTAYAGLDTGIVEHSNRTRRVFTYWSGDASGTNYAQSNPIIMNGPKTVKANWKTQYLLAVRTSPAGLIPQPTRNVTGDPDSLWRGWWYDASTNVELTAPSVSYLRAAACNFQKWQLESIDKIGNPIKVVMNQPHEAIAYYTLQTPVGGVTVSIDKSVSADAFGSFGSWIIFTFAIICATVGITTLARYKKKRK